MVVILRDWYVVVNTSPRWGSGVLHVLFWWLHHQLLISSPWDFNSPSLFEANKSTWDEVSYWQYPVQPLLRGKRSATEFDAAICQRKAIRRKRLQALCWQTQVASHSLFSSHPACFQLNGYICSMAMMSALNRLIINIWADDVYQMACADVDHT